MRGLLLLSLLRFLSLLGSSRLLGFLRRRLGFGLRLWLLLSGRRGGGWFRLRRVSIAGGGEPFRRRLGWRWRSRARRRFRSRSLLNWGSWRRCSLLGDYRLTLDGLKVIVKEIVIGAAPELVFHFPGRNRSVQTSEYAKLVRSSEPREISQQSQSLMKTEGNGAGGGRHKTRRDDAACLRRRLLAAPPHFFNRKRSTLHGKLLSQPYLAIANQHFITARQN